MRLPGFDAETSLYKTSRHYRMIGKFGQADGTIYPTLSINDLFKSSNDSIDPAIAGASAGTTTLIRILAAVLWVGAGVGVGVACAAPTGKSRAVPNVIKA